MNYQPLVYLLSALLGLNLAYLLYQLIKLKRIYKSLGKQKRPTLFSAPRVEYKYYESDDVLTVEID